MNSLGVTGWEQWILGIYLIAHGCIHLIFLFYFEDKKTNVYTGWSRKSWLLEGFIGLQLTKYLGFATWIIIALLFSLSGLGVLDIFPLDKNLNFLLVIVSFLAILGFIIFFNGLAPTPYHWVLGIIIDLVIIIFISFFSNEILLMLFLLLFIWIYGMFLHTQVLKFFGKNFLQN